MASEVETICRSPSTCPGRLPAALRSLDGSSNIDVNISVGTIFSVLRNPPGSVEPTEDKDFLQPGPSRSPPAIRSGPATALVLTVGHGIACLHLDREMATSDHQPSQVARPIPRSSPSAPPTHAIGEAPVKRYRRPAAGQEGPLGKDYNMRWVASMVADVIHPHPRRRVHVPDGRSAAEAGQQAAPDVRGQPDGDAGRGQDRQRRLPGSAHPRRVMPDRLHASAIPVILGSKNEVERVAGYHQGPEQVRLRIRHRCASRQAAAVAGGWRRLWVDARGRAPAGADEVRRSCSGVMCACCARRRLELPGAGRPLGDDPADASRVAGLLATGLFNAAGAFRSWRRAQLVLGWPRSAPRSPVELQFSADRHLRAGWQRYLDLLRAGWNLPVGAPTSARAAGTVPSRRCSMRSPHATSASADRRRRDRKPGRRAPACACASTTGPTFYLGELDVEGLVSPPTWSSAVLKPSSPYDRRRSPSEPGCRTSHFGSVIVDIEARPVLSAAVPVQVPRVTERCHAPPGRARAIRPTPARVGSATATSLHKRGQVINLTASRAPPGHSRMSSTSRAGATATVSKRALYGRATSKA